MANLKGVFVDINDSRNGTYEFRVGGFADSDVRLNEMRPLRLQGMRSQDAVGYGTRRKVTHNARINYMIIRQGELRTQRILGVGPLGFGTNPPRRYPLELSWRRQQQ